MPRGPVTVRLLMALLLLIPCATLLALDANVAVPLTIERVYDSPDLSGSRPRALRFSPDGDRVTFLRPKKEDRRVLDLWAMDVAEGEPYRLVDSRVLVPEERPLSEAEVQRRERARITESGIVDYTWDQAGKAILVPLDGDVFLVDVISGEVVRLMATEAYETDASISPDGRYVSFVREQNLWLHDLTTGKERALTNAGGGLLSFGMAEFIAQEEMKRDTGYWWSPNGRWLAVTQVDETPVEVVQRFGITAEGVEITEQRYPRAGTANAQVALFVYEVASGKRVRVALGDHAEGYLARVDWAEDNSVLYIQQQNRAQTQLDLLIANPETGSTRIALTERASTWVNLSDDFTSLAAGGFLWTSERSGFRHLYRYHADGHSEALTAGDWVIDEIAGVDQERERVFFTGWVETPLERHLYELPLSGGAAPRRITSGAGWWTVKVGEEGAAFLGTYSDPGTPPRTALYRMNGERIAWIVENTLDDSHPYGPYRDGHVTPEFGTLLAADGRTPLHWMLLRSKRCVAMRPCPAIVQVYGGPGAQTVRRAWQSPRDQFLAQAGYVLFKLDNRGMGNRGHAFEAAIHDRMGTVEVADQLVGLTFFKQLDYVDGDRVGLYGWSYGGYMALMTALRAPTAFAAVVAGAPVTDWSLYDTHYTERYMDTPQMNEDGYRRSAVLTHLEAGYGAPLLLVHGMADDNVTFDHSTRLYAALQETGRRFEMMTYPGQRHGIRPPQQQMHLLRTIVDFLARRLDGPVMH